MKIVCSILLLSLFLTGCGRGPAADTSKATPSSASSETPLPVSSPLTGFEKDLQYIRAGGYTYVWTFARKDGKPLDKDDSAFLRTNAPQVVDWVTTDEGKKVIAGTNFNLEEGNLAAIRKRFVVEDFSGR